MVRVGMLARGERRGLGYLTNDFYRNVRPARTVLIEPPHGLAINRQWYVAHPTEPVVLDEARNLERNGIDVVRDWLLPNIDVLYSAETFYDWRIVEWAREAGVRTVCHVMPEYYVRDRRDHPDELWLPTGWRAETFDALEAVADVRRVPVPAPRPPIDQRSYRPAHDGLDTRPHWVHVAGAYAMGDRNGTGIVIDALQHCTERQHLTVVTQDDETLGRVRRAKRPPHVQVKVLREEPDRWRIYEHGNVLLYPRRYGGLSMPVLEAMAVGLPVLMPGTEPQASEWPVMTVSARERGFIKTLGNKVPLVYTDPKALAWAMDTCARDPGLLADERVGVRQWAMMNGWDGAAGRTIDAELERAATA